MTDRDHDTTQQIQEDQYEFPYHYIPSDGDSDFSQTRFWSWGFRYLGGIRVVLDHLEDVTFDSLIDVGCGDGRFLRELHERYPNGDSLGVDYSERPIRLARAMNPGLEFETADIIDDEIDGEFEAMTSIEVLEHIPPADLPEFVEAMGDLLVADGTLILTVPHENKDVRGLDKHYQHFDSGSLASALEPTFTVSEFVYFDTQASYVIDAFERLLGWNGDNYLITNQRILNLFYRTYVDRYLYADTEAECARIAAVCRKS